MQLKQAEKITNIPKFLKSHNTIINSNCDERVKKPYRDRLELFNRLKDVNR